MRRVLQIALPFVFVLASVGVVVVMVRALSEEAEVDAVQMRRTVEVMEVATGTHAARVEVGGTVEADQQVDLVPQVQGEIIRIADGLAPGLPVRRGQRLAQIDDRDLTANLAQAEANLAQARLNLSLEEGRASQATREWELLGESPPTGGLALREPQLAAARAAVDSAEAAVRTARLNVERARLTAPFDALVVSESLDVGQLVGPGAPVARLIGTDRFRVSVSVPVADLRWLSLPDGDGDGGSEATIVQALGDGTTLTATGRVTRLGGQLDPQTRTASLLVVLDDPLVRPEGQLPILPGAYVRVTLLGAPQPNLVQLPRVALQDGDVVFLADAEDTLRRREVTVAFSTRDHVYISDGLSAGDRVITTPLSLPVEGLSLDVQQAVASTN